MSLAVLRRLKWACRNRKFCQPEPFLGGDNWGKSPPLDIITREIKLRFIVRKHFGKSARTKWSPGSIVNGLDLEMHQEWLHDEHIHAHWIWGICWHVYQPINLPVNPRWSLFFVLFIISFIPAISYLQGYFPSSFQCNGPRNYSQFLRNGLVLGIVGRMPPPRPNIHIIIPGIWMCYFTWQFCRCD